MGWRPTRTKYETALGKIEGLEGRELLESHAPDAYDRLDEIVVEAHKQRGAQVTSYRREGLEACPAMHGGSFKIPNRSHVYARWARGLGR